jgi:hypothetical protein
MAVRKVGTEIFVPALLSCVNKASEMARGSSKGIIDQTMYTIHQSTPATTIFFVQELFSSVSMNTPQFHAASI